MHLHSTASNTWSMAQKACRRKKKIDRHTTTDTEDSEPCMQNGDPTPAAAGS
jgi:hypothetical protein